MNARAQPQRRRRALRVALLVLATLPVCLAGPAARAESEAEAEWAEVLRRSTAAFRQPGSLRLKRVVMRVLRGSKKTEALAVLVGALDREGHHLDRLQARRADRWEKMLAVWSQPRRRHYASTQRRIFRLSTELKEADRNWFREAMFVGQLESALGQYPDERLAPFVAAAGHAGSTMHASTRAAVARHLARDLGSTERLSTYRRLLEKDRDVQVRLAALAALSLDAPAAEALLLRRLRDESWVVRSAARKRAVAKKMKAAVPFFIRGMRSERPAEVAGYDAALRSLTGEDITGGAIAWERWWQSNREEFDSLEEIEVGAEMEGPPAPAVFGIPLESDRVVFVLDASASMSAKAVGAGEGDPRRIDRARTQIERALLALPSTATFGLVSYNGAVRPWRPELVEATKENKAAAIRWLRGIKAEWNACLGGALRQAFRLGGLAPRLQGPTHVDTIVVIAAALPTFYRHGKAPLQDPQELHRLVKRWNRNERVRIHCVALSGPKSARVLEKIAADHGGRFAQP